MPSWTRRTAALATAASLLVACAPAAFDACPPVAPYSREFQARAAGELALLPPAGALEEMLKDYASLRDQLRACGRR